MNNIPETIIKQTTQQRGDNRQAAEFYRAVEYNQQNIMFRRYGFLHFSVPGCGFVCNIITPETSFVKMKA